MSFLLSVNFNTGISNSSDSLAEVQSSYFVAWKPLFNSDISNSFFFLHKTISFLKIFCEFTYLIHCEFSVRQSRLAIMYVNS